MKRWEATITYQTDNGPLPVAHSMDELEELHWLVEHGPGRDTIETITITPAQQRNPAKDVGI
jgi:hypothetical protein